MTRILMRSPHSPFLSSDHERAIRRDEIGSNAGNLLFPYALSRALMLPGVDIDYTKSFPKQSGHDGEDPAGSYDCFVIPLANAFRASFAKHLDNLSSFIESADMPCIVVGVGLQAGVSSDPTAQHPFDGSVRRFMRAVLDKSDCVGVRGEATGQYLEGLGFVPEQDFTVIGCPSLFLYGEDLPRPRPLDLSPHSSISLNCKVNLPAKIHAYLRETAQLIPDFHYVVQNTYELRSLYYGMNVKETYPYDLSLVVPEGYPTGRDNAAVRNKRAIGFVDVPSWLSYLEGKDLSFGTRIHGNIAGVLAGAPSFIVAPDSRVLELAQYHRIAHVTMEDLDETTDIFHLLDGVDFGSVLEGHGERFAHYLDFLHRNGLSTVFDEGFDARGALPFDERIAAVAPSGPITPGDSCSALHLIDRRARKAVKKALRKAKKLRRR